MDVIWRRPEPGQRRTRFTRDQIAAAAIRIADAEGFEAVSMRRVAQELGAGTMTLYHYVANKGELKALMDDAIMGELIVPDEELTQGWRHALTAIALSSRRLFQAHPWTFESMQDTVLGPNAMRHFEQSLRAVAGLGLEPTERLAIISLVDDFTGGVTQREPCEERDMAPERLDRLFSYMEELLDSGEFPEIAGLVPRVPGQRTADAFIALAEQMRPEDRFTEGLAALLDGIEARYLRR